MIGDERLGLYLVTGGCGFIGSHLADALIAGGHRVRILDDLSTGSRTNTPAGAEFLLGSVVDPDTVAAAMQDVDGCFHLAAVASVERATEDWIGTHRTNLTGTITIFDSARRARSPVPVPVVYASSAAVYGNTGALPLRETSSAQPISAYGADKLGCELHAAVAGRVFGVPTCGLRFFNVYGPRQDSRSPYSGVISIFCERLKSGEGITIFGDGQQTRDFVFVTDVVDALLAAMTHASIEERVFNVCSGRATSLLELADTIAGLLGVECRPRFQRSRLGDVRTSVGDPTAAGQGLGFWARTDLRSGLLSTLHAA